MKKVLSLVLAILMMLTVFVGCNRGPDLSYIVTGTVNGESQNFPIGPYRYYVQWMTDYYYAYLSTLAAQMEKEMKWTDMLQDKSLSGGVQTLSDTIIESAKDQYMSYLYIELTFDQLGLTLTAEDQKEIDRIIQKDWVALYGNDGFNSIRQGLGMTYDEFRNLMACNIKGEKIIQYYYGEGGAYEITAQEMEDYYANNYVRFKYVLKMTEDSDGNKYNDTKMAQVKADKDAVLDALSKGTPMEDLIVQYSDDYTKITDEMTVSEKESYEAQNKSMVEDGLIINDQGVFSETLATYYSITVEDDIVDKVFSLKNGEYAEVTVDNAIWVVQRLDHKGKEEYYTNVKDACFKALYADDLAAKHTDWRSRLNYLYNDAAIDAYRPEYLEDMFKFSESTGS